MHVFEVHYEPYKPRALAEVGPIHHGSHTESSAGNALIYKGFIVF